MMMTAEPTTSPTQVASKQDGGAESMRAIEQLQRGSKALLIEMNDSPKEAYEVRVVNSAQDRSVTPGQIVIELKLEHRPKA